METDKEKVRNERVGSRTTINPVREQRKGLGFKLQ